MEDEIQIIKEIATQNTKKIITDNKLKILEMIEQKNCCYEELDKKITKSMPLLSYHLNGNNKNEGLLQMGLITKVFKDEFKKTDFEYSITQKGRITLKLIRN